MVVKRISFSVEDFFFLIALSVPLLLIIGRGLAEAGMSIVSVYFLYRCYKEKNWAWTKTPWVRFVGVIWLYLISISFFADFDVASAMKRAVGWGRFPLFTIAFSTLFVPVAKYRHALFVFLSVLFSLIALDTIVQFLTHTSLTGYPLPEVPGRLSGPFGRDMVVGAYLTRLGWIALGLFFVWGATQITFEKRLVLPIAFAALMSITILLSGERVALAVFGLAAGVFWLYSKKLRVPLFVSAAVVLVIVAGLLWRNETLHTRFVTNTTMAIEQGNDSSYGRVWHNASVAWHLSPIFGVGPRNYLSACETLREEGGFRKEAWYRDEFNCARHPHNLYVEWLVETGVIGFLLFIGLVGLWIKTAWQNFRNVSPENYYAALGFLVALIPFLWPIMSSMSFFSNWNAILFWWTLSFSMTRLNQSR